MKRIRYKIEQIIRILREADSGKPIQELCREHQIVEQTFYRWRIKYADLELDDTKRVKEFEEENRRLKSCWPKRSFTSMC